MKNFQIEDFARVFRQRKPRVIGSYRYYSVLVPLVEKEGELNILYEVRGEQLKRQPGEVCFPGGQMEKGETPKQCAVRETAEELNIKESDVEIIAPLDYIHTYSNFTMYAYLGVIDYEVVRNAQVNAAEVKEIFLVPVSFFVENKPYVYNFDVIPDVGDDFPYDMINSEDGYHWRKGIYNVPIYRYEDYVIWGLTGRMTYNLINLVTNEQN